MTPSQSLDETNTAELLARLRVLVLAVGEASQPPWWRTQFMGETGLRFLERLYPRTFFAAAVHAAGSAAREIHDRAIGRRGAYHLFRAPEHFEMRIRAHIAAFSSNQSNDAPGKNLGDTQKLLSELKSISGEGPEKATGPRRLGTAKVFGDPEATKRMAGMYHAAFVSGVQAFPYFESEGSGET